MGLDQIIDGAQSQSFLDILFLSEVGKNDHGNSGDRRIVFFARQNLKTIYARQDQVQKDQVGLGFFCFLQPLFPVNRLHYIIGFIRELFDYQLS